MATGPKRRTFTLQVRSGAIRQITFYLDGRKLKTFKQSQAKGGKFTISIDPRKLAYGAHRISVKALSSDPRCASTARTAVFVRPHTRGFTMKFTG